METFPESIKAAIFLEQQCQGGAICPSDSYLEGKGSNPLNGGCCFPLWTLRPSKRDPSLSLIEPITKQRL